jgi:hypothetical protein
MTDTINQNLSITCDAVVSMMNDDNFDQSKRAAIMTIIKATIRSESYVNSVKDQIKKINEDGQFDAKDLPHILIIIAGSKDFLSATIRDGVELKSTLKLDSMKYITFGVIYFVMLMEKIDPIILEEVKVSYSSLWNLISFDPKDLLIKADGCWRKCFPCCFKCACCPSQTLAERWT